MKTRISLYMSLACMLWSGASAANLNNITGQVEILGNNGIWSTVSADTNVTRGLRTGVGRAVLDNNAAQYTLGSNTRIDFYRNKPRLLDGQAYLENAQTAYALGHHLRLGSNAQVRIDMHANNRSLSVIRGEAMVSGAAGGLFNLKANQRLNLETLKVSNFSENNPWYQDKLVGLGAARLDGYKGQVEILQAGQWDKATLSALKIGDTLRTGKDSWAEIGFDDNSYVRLAAQSQLKITGVERILVQQQARRRVILELQKGSAWNVVEPGKGGYELRMGNLVASVRGTKFRVDDNLIKVIDGQVAADLGDTPSDIASGQQWVAGTIGTLVLDASDLANLQLDLERQIPFRYNIDWPKDTLRSNVNITVYSTPKSTVTLSDGQQLQQQVISDQAGWSYFQPQLADGNHTLKISIEYRGAVHEEQYSYTIDRTPPITNIQTSHDAQSLYIKGTVEDASAVALDVLWSDGSRQTLEMTSSTLDIQLSRPAAGNHVLLIFRDSLGNSSAQSAHLP